MSSSCVAKHRFASVYIFRHCDTVQHSHFKKIFVRFFHVPKGSPLQFFFLFLQPAVVSQSPKGPPLQFWALDMAPTLAVLGLFTLAISKCYRKVRARFFPDNSLVSRGKSHSSRASGLVVRCLLFKYSEEEGSHFFRHYETPPFFENFLMSPKCSFNLFVIF